MATLATETEQANEIRPDAPLSAVDRCDACGAQAYVRVTVSSGELLFCAHHAKRHHDKLKEVAKTWHDETARLSAGTK